MPSLDSESKAMDVDGTNKSSQINSMLMRAWRERWTDAQWGTNIKTILPSFGMCGDSCHLADNILQQAVVGSDANKLALSYLRQSLYSCQISYSAVIKRICKFDNFERSHCLLALLEFLDSIVNGITCRSNAEEISLPGSLLIMIHWLLHVYASIVDGYSAGDTTPPHYHQLLNILTKLLDKVSLNAFLIANMYVAKRENADLYKKIHKKLSDMKNILNNKKFAALAQVKSIEDPFTLILVKIDGSLAENDSSNLLIDECESITYCLQPFVAVNVLLNPNGSVQNYVSHLQMIQHLKNYSISRLYSELIRSALISLYNISRESEISRESMWFAFTFIKVPYILKQMNAINDPQQNEYSAEVVAALEMLIDDPMLDYLDTSCACNTIEYLLNELAKHNLITAQQIQQFASRRDPVAVSLSKMDLNHQPTSIIKNLKKAEAPLSGILITLDNDYNKMQEPLLGMLCELLSGNNFELILSVATMEGKLKTFVSRLIRWNENSKQIAGEAEKPAQIRQSLFDVSFLILVHIVQMYGSDIVLDEHGDTFFEKWVREFMLEKGKNKSPMNMVHQCESSKVDEFLMSMNASTDASTVKTSSLKWNEICTVLPGVLYNLLVAWEHDTISAAEVKVHLDTMKNRLCSYSVCAASWLCCYMQTVRDEELLKPLNMVQQFLAHNISDEMKQVNNFKERLNLTSQIIRKMQTDAQQNQKIRSPILNIVSNQPLEEQFHEVWKTISARGWLSIKATQILENLLQSCGPYWMVSKMVNEILYCKFAKDMSKSMDIVFAIMHLNIEKCTITLLTDLLPMILLNKTQKFELIEPQLSALARLCVYCIISTLGIKPAKAKTLPNGTDDNERPAKIRKLEDSPFDILASGQEKGPNLINADNNGTPMTSATTTTKFKMREPLRICLRDLLQSLYQLTFTNELTPKVVFVHQFLTYLHRCDRNRIGPVLNLIPTGLMKNLLKVMSTNEFSYDYILRMYDLNTESGRRCTLSDLSLFQSIRMKNLNSIDI